MNETFIVEASQHTCFWCPKPATRIDLSQICPTCGIGELRYLCDECWSERGVVGHSQGRGCAVSSEAASVPDRTYRPAQVSL